MALSRVEFHPGSIWINGRPLILLTSSLFYFRIPSAEWRSRLRTVHALGYNAIDVYFPWNYHELEPGLWDFSGERDVRGFLQQAKEEGLWVVARPGPYICSEWDGGSLPAFLNVEPGLQLRENNPQYLTAVRCWYDKIMPLLAEYQIDQGGSVILVQVENELDFYDCADRAGMMTVLRDLALAHGISIPLVACAGQGDIAGASGGVSGIVPACNFYFDSSDPHIEARVRHYSRNLSESGHPLCITETNRSHTDLRRLLAGGAKLLGPYLQTGGTDFGFTTGVTNWGEPLAFMTSHYDFGGMISPLGKVRPEGSEAILLTKMIAALGPALALSIPTASPPLIFHGTEGHALALNGGGWLIGLPNTGGQPVEVWLGDGDQKIPRKSIFKIEPDTCPFVLVDFPLIGWGCDAHIAYATAELVECAAQDRELALTFAVDGAAELLLNFPTAVLAEITGWQVEQTAAGWRLWVEHSISAAVDFIAPDGNRLILKTIDRAEAVNLHQIGLAAWQVVSANPEPQEIQLTNLDWRVQVVDSCSPSWFEDAKPCKPGSLYLEENNIYRGFGWYRAAGVNVDHLAGLLIRSGADVLSSHLNGNFLGTLVPGGGDAFIPLSEDVSITDRDMLVIRAEIWGHSNFDDHRLPALRLKSMRGIGGLAAIRKIENLTPNWFYQHRSQIPARQVDPSWPMIYFGGWSSTDEPSQGVYYREVLLTEDQDTRVLHFPGIQVTATVYLDGQMVTKVNPFTPFVDISQFSKPGESACIAVVIDQDFRRQAGEVLLYQGDSLQKWDLAGWDEGRLAGLAQNAHQAGTLVDWPLTLAGGEMAWLHTKLPLSVDWAQGIDLQVVGQGLKVSAWVGSRLIGRIWLPSEMRPRMAGGSEDRMVLPAAWVCEAGGELHLLLESVSPSGQLTTVRFIPET